MKYLESFSQSPNAYEIVQLFSIILKSAIKICDIDLAPAYNDIINGILTVFRANPIKHAMILTTFSHLIFNFEKLPQQQEWFKNNFTDFNIEVINIIKQKQDPDLIREFIAVHSKVYEAYSDFYIEMPLFDDIITFLFEIYRTVSEYKMSRELLLFFHMIFCSPMILKSKKLQNQLPNLIGNIMFMFSDVPINFINQVFS